MNPCTRWRAILFLLVAGVALLACGSSDGDEESGGNDDEEIAAGKIETAQEADLDSDGIPDDIDDDIDGDGFSNDEEGSGDSDGDGIPDVRDRDSDNDGRLDVDEGDGDTDGDGIDDRVDPDSDADGLADGADPSDEENNSDQAIDDPDGDSVDAAADNCPLVANPEQKNRYGEELDGDGSDAEGDACDDTDGDEVLDLVDGCPLDDTRTTQPCEIGGDNETASCLGMAGSVDPNIIPVEFSTSGASVGGSGGGAPPPDGTAYFGAIDGVAGLFGACVPLNPGDGSPWFMCEDAVQGALPGAEIMGASPDGIYLAVRLEGAAPEGFAFDLSVCGGDGGQRLPTLTAAPELTTVDEFARARFPFEVATNPGELAGLEPEEIAELTTDEQVALVDDALGELDAGQVVEVEIAVLAEVPASKVLALSPEIIVLMPVDTLDSIASQDLAAALDNDLSDLPAGYLRFLTLADLQVIDAEALATLEAGQLELLGVEEQQFVGEVLGDLPGDGTGGP